MGVQTKCDFCHRPAITKGRTKKRCKRHLHAKEARVEYPSTPRKPGQGNRRKYRWGLAGDPIWEKVSKQFLAENPFCERCKKRKPLDGGPRFWPSTDCDHIIPLSINLRLAYDPNNLQALCHSCHSIKSGLERQGKFVDYVREKIIVHELV